MAKKPNISTVNSGYQGTATLNSNFQNIRDQFDNTLSRDGSTPNAMLADLDMNGYAILNVGPGTSGGGLLTVDAADLRYVNQTGDTMTGNLTTPALYTNGLFINGNPVLPDTLTYNGIVKETKIATSGQTVFNLSSISYTPGINNLAVYVDGVYQRPANYTENSATQVTFSVGLHVGAIVDFVVLTINSLGGTADAVNLTYTAPGSGTVSRTIQSKLNDTVSINDFGADPTGVNDSSTAIQNALNYAIPLGLSVVGTGKYKISQTITIPAYRTSPPVSLDFVTINFFINQLTYTGTTGSAISVSSPTTSVYIKKLIGPNGSGSTVGLTISGQGDANHRVDYVTGFGTNVSIYQAYSHTVTIGYSQDATIGVLLYQSNHIKLFAGRLGGQFSPATTVTDPTTCDIGVKVDGGTANEIHATIEYCKRTTNSVGLYDSGVATYYIGYIESCAKYNLYAIGRNGRYYSTLGTNLKPSGLYLENNNQFFWTLQEGGYQETPTVVNSTLAFNTLSLFESNGFSRITGVDGYKEILASSNTDIKNAIISSSDLSTVNWNKSVIGSANWGTVTTNTSVTSFTEIGYKKATQFTFPSLPNSDDIYRISQTNRIVNTGPIHYGLWVYVVSGEIDVQVRLLESTNNVQSKQVVSLSASDKWINIASSYIKTTANATDVLYELQFRTTTGAVVKIANTYIVNNSDLAFAPYNISNTIKTNIKGISVNGNTFEQGVRINGLVQNQISPPISSAGNYVFLLGDYPVYLVTGGWTGNLFLDDVSEEGTRIIIKRDGVAATGVMQVIPVGTIDGSSSAINIAPAYTVLELIWSNTHNGWLRIK